VHFASGEINYMVLLRDKNGAASGPISYFGEGGVLRRRGENKDGKPAGEWMYYYPNGALWAVVPYNDGMMHGVVRSFHSNGTAQAIKPYKSGKLHGERVITDHEGDLVNGSYTELLPFDSAMVLHTCVNGRPHGRITVMRGERKVLEGQCINGFAEGAFDVYSPYDGKLIYRDHYKNGKFKRSEYVSSP